MKYGWSKPTKAVFKQQAHHASDQRSLAHFAMNKCQKVTRAIKKYRKYYSIYEKRKRLILNHVELNDLIRSVGDIGSDLQ
jgi:hypothetical protein